MIVVADDDGMLIESAHLRPFGNQRPADFDGALFVRQSISAGIPDFSVLPADHAVIHTVPFKVAGLVATARREGENYSLFALAAAGVAPAFSDSDRRLTLVLAGFISRNPLPTWSRTLI